MKEYREREYFKREKKRDRELVVVEILLFFSWQHMLIPYFFCFCFYTSRSTSIVAISHKARASIRPTFHHHLSCTAHKALFSSDYTLILTTVWESLGKTAKSADWGVNYMVIFFFLFFKYKRDKHTSSLAFAFDTSPVSKKIRLAILNSSSCYYCCYRVVLCIVSIVLRASWSRLYIILLRNPLLFFFFSQSDKNYCAFQDPPVIFNLNRQTISSRIIVSDT